MNEILTNILSIIVAGVVLPLISLLGSKLVSLINNNIKNAKAKELLTLASNIVINAVQAVFQTYVESLKASGSFNAEAQTVALTKAKTIAISQMNDELKDYIKTNYGDLDTWLTTQIESSINLLKNK